MTPLLEYTAAGAIVAVAGALVWRIATWRPATRTLEPPRPAERTVNNGSYDLEDQLLALRRAKFGPRLVKREILNEREDR